MRTRTLAVLAGLAIVGMGATAVYAQAGDATKTPAATDTSAAAATPRIEVNQVGYLPDAAKRATVRCACHFCAGSTASTGSAAHPM